MVSIFYSKSTSSDAEREENPLCVASSKFKLTLFSSHINQRVDLLSRRTSLFTPIFHPHPHCPCKPVASHHHQHPNNFPKQSMSCQHASPASSSETFLVFLRVPEARVALLDQRYHLSSSFTAFVCLFSLLFRICPPLLEYQLHLEQYSTTNFRANHSIHVNTLNSVNKPCPVDEDDD